MEDGGIGLESGQAVGDVVFKGDGEEFSAVGDVFALDGACEGFVFHFLEDALGFDIVDGLGGLDEGAGGEKAGELIAGEEGAVEVGSRWNAGVICVGEDGVKDLFGPALLAKEGYAYEGVLGEGGVALVVHVME